ncbi:type II CRISPR-associated endonuclease Cas1 [Accumulibacter sp.]|uniref:type II CRISPR-associated endonuclease Cas1 n=1 Tax=Accumulibacter sp. TaxID=2053492 RepID=UPI0026272C2E|nr:type II CRISPR-associated endonuclease Cas1 [Accumulibacter sp.]
MGWRSVLIASPAALTLEDRALAIAQGGKAARVMLEDISVVVLDHAQISLTAPLLAACAEARIAVLTVNTSHLPNGVLIPYLSHSRALKVMTAQLEMSRPEKKRLWQRVVRYKIANQAAVLERASTADADPDARHLRHLARSVRSGDPDNYEAQAAQVYFRRLFNVQFNRSQKRFHNAALNYGYAVVRAAIARTLAAHGFLPAFGLFHHSEQNAFNLADDLMEPYRPLVDAGILAHYPEEPDRDLAPADKGRLVALLHKDVTLSSHTTDLGRGGSCTLLAAIDATVSGLSAIALQGAPHERLALPQLDAAWLSVITDRADQRT